MNLRTPRRRISPRTKRRYRAIREFFRRALGSSQPDIKIGSSIAVNVTDLKRKIFGLEQQLDEVNKHCQNIACLDCSERDSDSFQSEEKHARESKCYIPSEAKLARESNCYIPSEVKHARESKCYIPSEVKHARESNCYIPSEVKHARESNRYIPSELKDASESNCYIPLEVKHARESNCYIPSEVEHARESNRYIPSELKDARKSNCYIPSELNHEIRTIEQAESLYERKLNGTETKFIYKSLNGHTGQSDESENLSYTHDVIDAAQTQGMLEKNRGHVSRAKNKKSKVHGLTDCGAKLHKYRARSVYENFSSANSTSFHSLINRVNQSSPCYSGRHNETKLRKHEYTEPIPPHYHKVKRNNNDMHKESHDQKPNKIRKHKHHDRELDQDFLADIIRRQYNPVKIFGGRESDLSQISAPVCRDQEFSIHEDILEGAELCSCCYDGKKYKTRHRDLREMRSICDTRLYSSQKHTRGMHSRVHVDNFNDSDLYDLIPVKEKSSPKTRRKFTEDNMIPCKYYREVLPAPRTLRPQLILKSQYNREFEDYMAHVKHLYRKGSSHRRRRQHKRVELASDVTSVEVPNLIIEQPRKTHKHVTCQVEKQERCQRDIGTMSSSQYAPYTDQVNVTVDRTFNKTEEVEIPVDKTDKVLSEIKDILQSFLHEINKATISSQCDKSDTSSKTGNNGVHLTKENSTKLNGIPKSRHSINNFGIRRNGSPHMAPFQNHCFHPVIPLCPMNCPISMQNGFMSTQSYTCICCGDAVKEPAHDEHCCNRNVTTTRTCHTETCHTETEDLSPIRKKDYDNSTDRNEARKSGEKLLTARCVGECLKHDAKVGTTPLKCYSKSYEAIGIGMDSEQYTSQTNTSYSDTILDKLSLEVTLSKSETEMDMITTGERSNWNKFSKVLRSIGFLKKKKDVIKELSESEIAIDEEVKPELPRSPYRQEIPNYMMHGQDYNHPPPVTNYQRPNEYQPDYNPPYNPGLPEYAQPRPPPYHSKQRPTAPPFHTIYDNPYKQMQPLQVPLFLREIEVKSQGTQSDRKISIFRKIQKKIQPPKSPDDEHKQDTSSTHTLQASQNKPAPITKPLFNWKNLQAKAGHGNTNPIKFSMKAKQDLATGDLKLRNTVLRKLFYKRNPISPRNLIARTLLGKQNSSFDEARIFY